MKKYDVIVIGSGSAGLTVAYTAKGFGKKVLIVDKNKPGGECTWSGCVPSKSLIHIASELAIVRKYDKSYNVSYKSVLEQVRNTREKVYLSETPDIIKNDGIDYVKGFAKFIDKQKVKINNKTYYGKKIFIATGSSPFVPPIKGIETVSYDTNDTIFEREDLEDSMIVLGGGAIGVELAMALNDLGIEVSLVEMADRLLIREEPELSKELENIMIKKGIKIYTNSKAVELMKDNDFIELIVEKESESKKLKSKGLIVSVGRKPNLEGLGLEKASISYNKKGIEVDEYLMTTNKNIYAVGDVSSRYQFSHMAFSEGVQAVKNALLPFKKKMNYNHVPWCTYSNPELARTGYTEEEARKIFGDKIHVYTHDYKNIDRAKTDENTEGTIKLILDSKGKLIGASILGTRAGELIGELQVIKSLNIKASKLGNVIHPYPTYAEALSKLGRNITVDFLLNNTVIKLFKK